MLPATIFNLLQFSRLVPSKFFPSHCTIRTTLYTHVIILEESEVAQNAEPHQHGKTVPININCRNSTPSSCTPVTMNRASGQDKLIGYSVSFTVSTVRTFREILPSMYDPMIISTSFTMIMMYQNYQNSNFPSRLSSVLRTRRKYFIVLCEKV